MPRSSRGRSAAPARPTAAPARSSAPAPQQTRQASTAAHTQQRAPPQTQAPQQQGSGSGLFGQMASTAAGVAVGSSIGHAIGGFFGGGSSAAPPAEVDQAQAQSSQYTQEPAVCGQEIGSFRKCMDQNQGDLTICGWYLDQLKACQQAARPY